jgi:tetratricopeptide (TPR) repeat protein
MSSKFEQANTLVAQKKYKKALVILRKSKQSSFESIGLEVVCLFNEKNFQLSKIKMELALKLASSKEQRLSVLNNLAAVSEKLNQVEQAISYLKQVLKIDASPTTAAQRNSLIEYAYTNGDHETIEKYAPMLINTSAYCLQALLILSKTAIEVMKFDEALAYLSRIEAELRSTGGLEASSREIVHVLNSYHTIKAYKKEQSFLNYLEPKFQFESWFCEIQSRLDGANKDKKQSLPDKKTETTTFPTTTASTNNISKQSVVVENTPTLRLIQKLKALLESKGAKFSSNMLIVEHGGEIAVKTKNAQEEKQLLMNVPLSCMPLICDYKFLLDNQGMLVANAKKTMLNPKALQIMILLTDLYNAANKLESWKSTYPLFSLAGFENIVDKLLAAKSSGSAYKMYYASQIEQIRDDVIINSFLGSRIFSFNQKDLRKAGIKSKEVSQRSLIPVLDLINHNMNAPQFHLDPEKSSLKTYSQKSEANSEIFVQYNLDDPLVTLLTYGFIDTSAKWIYSIPLVLKCQTGLSIEIRNDLDIVDEKDLPGTLTGLRTYFPARCVREGTVVKLSKLIIPGLEYKQSLVTVLSYVLKNIDLESFYSDEDKLNREVKNLEQQLLEQNISYWNELSAMIDENLKCEHSMPPSTAAQLIELCDFCLVHIKQYINQTGHILKR